MSRWATVNRRAGLVVFGLPALGSLPAAVATVARFGFESALVSAGPAVAVLTLPLMAWLVYLRRQPMGRRGGIVFCLAAFCLLVAVLTSPVWWWSGPALLVLLSELMRLLAGKASSRPSMAGLAAIRAAVRW